MIYPGYEDLAGMRDQRKNRIAGGYISLYDGEFAGFDTAAGKWNLVCEIHSGICSFERIADARKWLTEDSSPDWCEECGVIAGRISRAAQ